MNYFLKVNKNFLTYTLIMLIVIPIPLLLVVIVLIGFNSYKSKINTCNSCGAISLGLSETCMNCGANLEKEIKKNQLDKNPSKVTIEVKAEEVN